MNKIVVITGGGSGLGFSCANEIGKEGYQVLISGANEKKIKNPLKKN